MISWYREKIQNTQASSNASQAGLSQPPPTLQGAHSAISSSSPLTFVNSKEAASGRQVRRQSAGPIGSQVLPTVSTHRNKFSSFSQTHIWTLPLMGHRRTLHPPLSVPTNQLHSGSRMGSLFIECSSFPGWTAQERILDFKAMDLDLDPVALGS